MNENTSGPPPTGTDLPPGPTRRVALVTGGNRGIGAQIAHQLATHGMTVLVGSRDPAHGAGAVADLRAAGADAHPLVLDVTDPATIDNAAAEIRAGYGRLDVLVNNAGIAGRLDSQAPGLADMDTVRATFETNVFGVIGVTEAMLPLLQRSAGARVVNISSDVGSLGQTTDPDHYMSKIPAGLAYGPSKTALNAVTVQYAKELGPDGILVNAAAPGACDTDFTRGSGLAAPRTAAQGAAVAVRLADLPADGATGGFFGEDGPVRW
ncbi:NAD(P)-dependent dehydrogenase (short-subunit alcohol dehydrogenase family) [Lipingzhangella halophila]|uniref:NAD(P)-dependent dehydrogenase (Short-subunit alcohol dehydrogenase family) n=1 Tax=Lipingzhangella halophila TaxID=1783352 RepID=A0A7W7W240_9ACTN|nr:SDR family oxidoreductase [Lipingzhangella halophila]MBB4930300.1 NAD(P)-dependent dehydrogenase (short-subunit alcohol dehydrogenase family) [Lipingzhangella halophila]